MPQTITSRLNHTGDEKNHFYDDKEHETKLFNSFNTTSEQINKQKPDHFQTNKQFLLKTIPTPPSIQLKHSFNAKSISCENDAENWANSNSNAVKNEMESELETNKKKKKTKEKDSYVEDKKKAGVPIDKGWAWMIVFSCHLLCLLVSGVNRSHGILLVEVSSTFNRSTVDSAWIFSLASMLATMLSPFSNTLAANFSCRKIVFVGTAFIFTGMMITSFSKSLELIYFSYGALTGFGYGLVYSPALCMVGYYFDKFRMLANGISVAGSSMGSIIIPYLVEFLISKYGLRGCFTILASVMLHLCIVAALCRPMEYYVKLNNIEKQLSTSYLNESNLKSKRKLGERLKKCTLFRNSSKNQCDYQSVLPSISFSKIKSNDCSSKEKERELIRSCDNCHILRRSHSFGSSSRLSTNFQLHSDKKNDFSFLTRSCETILSKNSQDDDQSPIIFYNRSTQDEQKEVKFEFSFEKPQLNHSESKLHSARKEIVRFNQQIQRMRSRPTCQSCDDITNLFERATLLVAHEKQIPLTDNVTDNWTSSRQNISGSGLDITFDSLQNLSNEPMMPTNDKKSNFHIAVQKFFLIQQKVITKKGEVKISKGVSIFDPTVFRMPPFYFLAVTVMISMNIFAIAFVILPSHAIDLGIDKKSAGQIVQFCGITDFFGRLLSGFIADRICCSKRTILLVNQFLFVLIWAYLYFFGQTYYSLVAFSLMIGLVGGSSMSLYAIVVVDRLGLEKLAGAYGMCLFSAGAFSFVHVTFASWIRDLKSTWRPTFILNMMLACLGCCMLISDLIYSKKFERNESEQECIEV